MRRDLEVSASRDQHNAAMRERMRLRCAAAAMVREAAAEDYRRGAQAAIPRRTEIDLAPDSRLIVGSRLALFTYGPLEFRMERVDQASIGRCLMRLSNPARSWPDGTMRGIKRLRWTDKGWVSPARETMWKDGCLSATDFDEAGDLRGEAGIHATWSDTLTELRSYDGKLVEISGWGQCTVGDIGWRAQHARVVRELI